MGTSTRDLPKIPPRAPGRVTTVRRFVEMLLRSRSDASTASSATGFQLEAASRMTKRGAPPPGAIKVHDDSSLHNATWKADAREHERAMFEMIWSSLSDEEQAVMVAQHMAIDHREVSVLRPISSLRPGDGAELDIGRNREAADRGEVIPEGSAYFRTSVPVVMTYDEVAARMNLTRNQVHRRVKTAHAKLLEHRLFQLLRNGDEE
jgi:hypothetical protein